MSGSGSCRPVGTTQSRYSPPFGGQKPMLKSSPNSSRPNSVGTENFRRALQSALCSGLSSERSSRAARVSGDSRRRGPCSRVLAGGDQ
jgi:hypothetical protein